MEGRTEIVLEPSISKSPGRLLQILDPGPTQHFYVQTLGRERDIGVLAGTHARCRKATGAKAAKTVISNY